MRSCLKKIPAQPATPKKIALGCLGPRTSRGSISRRPHGLDARNPNLSDFACDEHTCRKWHFIGLYTGQGETRALRNKNPSRNPRRLAVNTDTRASGGTGPAEWKDGGPDGGRARPSRTPCAGGFPLRGSERSRREIELRGRSSPRGLFHASQSLEAAVVRRPGPGTPRPTGSWSSFWAACGHPQRSRGRLATRERETRIRAEKNE